MADFEFSLEGEEACKGRGGGYMGVLYHQLGRTFKRTQIVLPAKRTMMAKEPGAIIHLAQEAAADRLGGEVPTNQLIALSVARMCMRSMHEVGERTQADSFRPERVAAYAIAKTQMVEELAPQSRIEKQVSGHGIGRARSIAGMTRIDPLIYLPVTTAEAQNYHVVAAIRALANGPSIDKQPYIALHYSAESVLERIVLPEEL
jgi:hypothetical protein